MHLILRYPNGKRLDALLLALRRDLMRIAVRGRNETLELEFVYDRWISEEGERVSIDAILADRYQGGLQTKVKYSAVATAANTAAAAARSTMTARMKSS